MSNNCNTCGGYVSAGGECRKCATPTNPPAKHPQVKERFLAKTKAVGECLEWQGGFSNKGYGYFYGVPGVSSAHRAAYTMFTGPIPKGLLVCHRCDNRKCVRPEHLFLGTYTDNNRDRDAKGRGAAGERNGSARLTQWHAEYVRKLYAMGMPKTMIAQRFETTLSHVQRIIAGVNWCLKGAARSPGDAEKGESEQQLRPGWDYPVGGRD